MVDAVYKGAVVEDNGVERCLCLDCDGVRDNDHLMATCHEFLRERGSINFSSRDLSLR